MSNLRDGTNPRHLRRPLGHLSTQETMAATGAMFPPARLVGQRKPWPPPAPCFRQLDSWASGGRLVDQGVPTHVGPGYTRWWPATAVKHLRHVVARLDWGMTVDAAFRPVDPPLPTHHGAVPCTPGN